MTGRRVAIRCLGPISVLIDDAPPPPELLWKKNVATLLLLAHSPRRTCSRERLIGALWSERPEKAARQSMREALRILRKHLGECAVRTQGDQMTLGIEDIWLDTAVLESALERKAWTEAAQLVSGEFAAGFSVPDAHSFEEWLSMERTRWRTAGTTALVRAGDAALATTNTESAVTLAHRAVELDSHSELAQTLSLKALALAGHRPAALEVFERYRAGLADLGVEPSAAVTELARRVSADRGGRPPRPADPVHARDHRLVGRGGEMKALLALVGEVARGRAGVGIVVGDPGVGKTRLVEEVVARAGLDDAFVVAAMRAVPADDGEPGGGLVALWRSGLAAVPAVTGAHPGALATLIAEAPTTADHLPSIPREEPMPLPAAFRDVIAAAVEERPVVLWIDDAQWVDVLTLQTCRAILRDLAERPFLFIVSATARPSRPEIEELMSKTGRDLRGECVHLDPFSEDDVCELVREMVALDDRTRVNRIGRRIAADSGGIPHLAVELARAVKQGLDLDRVAPDWPAPFRTLDDTLPADLPEAVIGAIRIRFRLATDVAQDVLRVLAVLVPPVPAERMVQVTGTEPRTCHEALDALEWDRWVEADPRGYSFAARIVRDVILEDLMTAGQRARILARATG